jgi:hypothetical protein
MPTLQTAALAFSVALSVASVRAADSPEDLIRLLQKSNLTQADLGTILEISATMETCAPTRPGFEQKTAKYYAVWKQTNQLGLRVMQPTLDAMKTGARKPVGEDFSLNCARLERYFSRSHPDPNFATPELVWGRYLEALRSSDRETALDCLTGPALSNLGDVIESQPIEFLHRLGSDFPPMAATPESGDRTTRNITRKGQAGQISFVRALGEWRIESM